MKTLLVLVGLAVTLVVVAHEDDSCDFDKIWAEWISSGEPESTDIRLVKVDVSEDDLEFIVTQTVHRVPQPFRVYRRQRDRGYVLQQLTIEAPQGYSFCEKFSGADQPHSHPSVLSRNRLWTCVQNEEIAHVIGFDLTKASAPTLVRVGPVLFPRKRRNRFRKPDMPTALHARSGILYVGLPGQVLVADEPEEGRQLRSVFSFGPNRKEVDAIVSTPTRLVAVDDVMTPKYIFTFDISKSLSSPDHLFTAEMGHALNARYLEADLQGDTLALSSKWDSRGGSGIALELFRMNDTAFEPIATINRSARRDRHACMGLFETRAQMGLLQLRGLVLVEDRLLLVASPREGLLLFAQGEGENSTLLEEVGRAEGGVYNYVDAQRIGRKVYALRIDNAGGGLELVGVTVARTGNNPGLETEVLQVLDPSVRNITRTRPVPDPDHRS